MILNDNLIDEDKTMIEAMQSLDKAKLKVLFVEKSNLLVGAITDGDIRRWILKKGNINAQVKDIANHNPKYLYESEQIKAKEYMKKYSVEALPIINPEGKVISIVTWDDTEIIKENTLSIPIVIMAGGLGTRLYPYTKILPKPLIPIGELPIAEHIINRFRKFGCSEFYMIINHKKNMIKAYFNEIEKDYSLKFIDEDKPLGTGGGLSLLKGQINSTFILSNCDILIEEDYGKMYELHKKENNFITMVCSLKNIKIPYGVVEIGINGEIESMKEKPELNFFTNTGIYIVEPEVIEELDVDKNIGFPDIIEQCLRNNRRVGVYPISENSWMDMGQLDEMEEMRIRLSRND